MPMIVSVGGSVSTGSSPWIDILSSTPEFNVVKGELRIGESGLYDAMSRLYLNEKVGLEEVLHIKSVLLGYGKSVSLPVRFILAALSRAPYFSKGLKEKIRRYRLARRGYDKIVPGFSHYSRHMLDELVVLADKSGEIDSDVMRNKVVALTSSYLSSISSVFTVDGSENNSVIIDQFAAPRLLFDEFYGPLLAEIMVDVKFIVVRRDPRDQFIDLLSKKKKHYHEMSLDSAVHAFVEEYLPRYDLMKSMLKICDKSRVVDVWFEDITFNINGALKKLEYFMGRENNPLSRGGIDESLISKKIRMFDKGIFATEISYIEKNMQEHLYENN